jgi:hypothetical protein
MSFANNVYNTLNGVPQTAWTPELTFGGSNAGITYSGRGGNYMRIGNVVFWNFQFTLTSKGSATGIAEIGGFPIAVRVGGGCPGTINLQNALVLDANFTWASLEMTPLGTTHRLRQTGGAAGTSTTDIDDTNFANNTFLIASGFYFV